MREEMLSRYIVKANKSGAWSTLRIPKALANELVVDYNVDLTNTATEFFKELLKELNENNEESK